MVLQFDHLITKFVLFLQHSLTAQRRSTIFNREGGFNYALEEYYL